MEHRTYAPERKETAKGLILPALVLLALVMTSCAATQVRPSEEQYYRQRIYDISQRFQKNWNEFAYVPDSRDVKLVYQTSSSSLDEIRSLRRELASITPPLKHSDFHALFTNAIEKYMLALSRTKKGCAILLGLEEGTAKDATRNFQMAREAMDEGDKFLKEAQDLGLG